MKGPDVIPLLKQAYTAVVESAVAAERVAIVTCQEFLAAGEGADPVTQDSPSRFWLTTKATAHNSKGSSKNLGRDDAE